MKKKFRYAMYEPGHPDWNSRLEVWMVPGSRKILVAIAALVWFTGVYLLVH